MSRRPPGVDDVYPPTPMQHLMLLHAIHSEDDILANQVVYEVRGALNESRLTDAWSRVIERHPALRTAFLWKDLERPVQVVRTEVRPPITIIDLTGHSEEKRDTEVARLQQEDRRASFRLEKAPLMRFMLIRLEERRSLLVWSIHHLIVDRWSHGVLFADLARAYEEGPQAETWPPVHPFRDYVRWLHGRARHETAAYWQSRLEGFTAPTLLDPASDRAAGGRRSTRRDLSPDVSALLAERVVITRTTAGSWLQGAIALAIARRARRMDVVFGLTVSGRPAELDGVEDMVGTFVNNLPVRVRLFPDQPVIDWVREIQIESARRQRFEHASPVEVLEAAEVEHGLPLFDLLVLMNLSPPPDPQWPGFDLVPVSATLDAGYPFLLAVRPHGDGLAFEVVHDDPAGGLAAEFLVELHRAIEDLLRAAPEDELSELLPNDLPPPGAGPARAAVPPQASGPSRRPEQLLALWKDVLGVDSLTLDDDFFVLGGTSLQAAQLFARIERLLGRSLPLSTLLESGSVRALLKALDEPVEPEGPVVRIRSQGTRPPLFVVPGIGGNVVGLVALAEALGRDQPFFGLPSRGLADEREPLTTIEAIADDHAAAVAETGVSPVDLLGLCWGAAVAFEMVDALVRRSVPVRSVALLDPAVLVSSEAVAAKKSPGFVRGRMKLYWDELQEADWRGRGRLIIDRATKAAVVLRRGELGEQTQLERRQQRVRQANLTAVTQYRPTPGRMTARLFITADRELWSESDPRLEWLSLIEPVPDVVRIPGVNSGDAIGPNNVGPFAKALADWLASVRRLP